MSIVDISASQKSEAITPSDTALLTYNGEVKACRGIYVGGAGDITLKNDVPASVVFQNIPAGSVLPVATEQVLSTGTDATLLIALY